MPMNPPAPDIVTTTGSAPTRLCLGGEDLDWIGGPALLTAIDLHVSVTYQRQPRSRTLTIRSEGALSAQLTLTEPDWLTPTTSELELTRLCWQHAQPTHPGGRISVTSPAPPHAGLASSAATVVAALRALAESPQDRLPGERLIRVAYHVERRLAGRPVGPMDFVPAATGGTSLVDAESEHITRVARLSLPVQARFLVVDTRTPRDTGAVIAWKRRRLADGDRDIRVYANRMPELVADQARLLGPECDLDGLGQTLNDAQDLLRRHMRVSTPLIDTCATRLRHSGALGVKLTGTGLGGCVFALTTATADTHRLVDCLRDLPVATYLLRPQRAATSLKPRHTSTANDVLHSATDAPPAAWSGRLSTAPAVTCDWMPSCPHPAAHRVRRQTRPGLILTENVCERHLTAARQQGYRRCGDAEAHPGDTS